jgi:hypothetical protein
LEYFLNFFEIGIVIAMKVFVIVVVLLLAGKSFANLRKLLASNLTTRNKKCFKIFTAPNFPICRRNDPNISHCIAKAIEILKPRLESGDFSGGYQVPKLEPMFIKE